MIANEPHKKSTKWIWISIGILVLLSGTAVASYQGYKVWKADHDYMLKTMYDAQDAAAKAQADADAAQYQAIIDAENNRVALQKAEHDRLVSEQNARQEAALAQQKADADAKKNAEAAAKAQKDAQLAQYQAQQAQQQAQQSQQQQAAMRAQMNENTWTGMCMDNCDAESQNWYHGCTYRDSDYQQGSCSCTCKGWDNQPVAVIQ